MPLGIIDGLRIAVGRRLFALVTLALGLSFVVPAAPATAQAVGEASGFIGGLADHLVDPDGTLALADMGRQSFAPADGKAANRGLSANERTAFWLRLKVERLPGDDADWVLSLREPRTRSLQLFAVDASGRTVLERLWRSTGPGPVTAYPVIPLARADIVGTTLYLKIRTVSSMRASLWLEPESRFLADYSGQALFFGALLGLLVTLAVYCAATGAATEDLSLVLLAGVTVSIAAYIAGDRGLIESLIWPGVPGLSGTLSLGGTLMIYATSVLFSAAFLQAPLRRRWSRIAVYGLALLFSLEAIGGSVAAAGIDLIVLRVSPWLGLLAIARVIGAGLATAWRQPRRAVLFLLCWSPALLIGLARIALNLLSSTVSASPLTVNMVYAGIATSCLLFAVVTSIELRQRAVVARAERATNERRFRDFAITASDDFWEADAEAMVTRTFEGAAPVAGLSSGSALPAQLAALGADAAPLVEALARRDAFRDVRLRLPQPGLAKRHLSLSGLPVFAADGSLAGWRGTLTDVSDQVAREWERGHQRVLAALGFLVGSIAHDVNNLLHPVLNLSRRVADSLPPGDSRVRLLGVVTDSARQAARRVAGVLSLARSRREARLLPFGAAVAESLKLIQDVTAEGTRLVAEVESRGGPVVAEPDVFRILSNLVGNAAAAMGNGGEVRVSFRAEGDESFVLEVADSGPGVSDAARRAFEESDGEMPGPGWRAGLGLTIVRHIVKSLDGRLEIRSNPAGGAIVALRVPAAAMAKEEEPT
ncbi:MAG: sensor histidine kinase [Reyranellaceae bacterium]